MYTYDIDAADMFDDRTDQFEKFGIPLDDIKRVGAAVTDMWADAPGGWAYEWSKLAKEYADRGDHYLASLVYGCAKFPCLTDQARVRAMQNQLEQFQLAAKDFPVAFERRIITVPYRDGTVDVPVHLVFHRRRLCDPAGADRQRRSGHLEDGHPPVVGRVHHRRRGDHLGLRPPRHR